ncbi:MAG: MerR family transcriptional regulator [Candidatus Marinimicrobia bacterium]|nr:MerR family transcriptional regulator [Candidatus Neomarinimicrobiota bacterium]
MSGTEREIRKLYYSISEVSEIADLKQYVLRYWETEFPSLKPKKNKAGNRIYRQSDVDMVFKIKDLLYDQKFTIEGARQQLRNDKIQIPKKGISDSKNQLKNLFHSIKEELRGILNTISQE